MATVDADFLIRLAANRSASTDAGTAKEAHAFDYLKTYAASSSLQVWSAAASLSSSATKDYDLQGLTQQDADGNTVRSSVSFSKVRALAIRNTKPGTGGTLKAGAAAADPWVGDDTPFPASSDVASIPRSAALVWISPDGGAVSSSSKVIRLEASSAQSFEILIVGES